VVSQDESAKGGEGFEEMYEAGWNSGSILLDGKLNIESRERGTRGRICEEDVVCPDSMVIC